MGLTSARVQQLLYALSKHCKRYLEIGCAVGATTSAVAQNSDIKLYCVDNWSQNLQPESNEFVLPTNDRDQFIRNLKRMDLNIFDMDLFAVDRSKIRHSTSG
jgi:cyclopropane fatty-acyl-phospholipid synthase-like methyltransferase